MASLTDLQKQFINPTSSFLGHLFYPADFTITIGNFSLPVHKEVLTEKSGFFKRLCLSQFKETQTNEVALHDDDTVHVVRMVCLLYNSDPWPLEVKDNAPSNKCITIEEMLRAAFRGEETKELDELLAKEKEAIQDVSRELDMYLMADKYDIHSLRHSCISRMFDKSPKSGHGPGLWPILDFLRDAVVPVTPLKARACVYLVENLEKYVEDERLVEMIKDMPEFVAQVLRGVAKKKKGP